VTKYRIVPIVYGNYYQSWKVQTKLGFLPLWRNIVNEDTRVVVRFPNEKAAESFITDEIEREKLNVAHLAKPTREFGS